MATHSQSDVQFEIGHVLFIDIVGYSKLLIDEQRERIGELKEIVRGTKQFRLAEAEGIMATKAEIYQAQGNLQEAAKWLPEINCQASPSRACDGKIIQLRLERNYSEAVQLLQPASLNSMMIFKRLRIGFGWLSCSALLAIRLVQRLPLNRRAIHLSGSTEMNRTTFSALHGCPTLML